jgi:hypothetical protein
MDLTRWPVPIGTASSSFVFQSTRPEPVMNQKITL